MGVLANPLSLSRIVMSCSTPELGENTQKNLPDGTKHITDFLYVIDPEAERRFVLL